MGDKLEVRIIIDATHKLGGNLYVHGRIHGIMSTICETYYSEIAFGIGRKHEGVCMKAYATPDEYEKFKTVLERDYPGLCKIGAFAI